jgi:hypothetical protein
MRIDLCSDISNVPVSWFHDNCRFRYQYCHQQIGALKVNIIADIEMETLMFGARTNGHIMGNQEAEGMTRREYEKGWEAKL